MNEILLMGGEILLVFAAMTLHLIPPSRRHARIFAVTANVMALVAMTARLLTVSMHDPRSWGVFYMLICASAALVAMPRRLLSAGAVVAMLLGEAACLVAATTSAAQGLLLAVVFGFAAALTGLMAAKPARVARVHFAVQSVGHLALLAGVALLVRHSFLLGASGWYSSGTSVAPVLIIIGLVLVSGLLPFQSGVADLYDRGGTGHILGFAAAPLSWFVVAALHEHGLTERASQLVPVLLGSAVLAAAACVGARTRHQAMYLARTCLLTLAHVGILVEPRGVLGVMVLTAYFTATIGMTVVEAIVDDRVGGAMAEHGGLALSLPQLAGFGAFFAFATANLPLTANFAAAEELGAALATFGPLPLLAGFTAYALLGFAAYRRFAKTFLGPASQRFPGLDLTNRERFGLGYLALGSVAASAILFLH